MNEHFGNISIVCGVCAVFALRWAVPSAGPINVLAFGAAILLAGVAIVFGGLGVRRRADRDGYLIDRKTAVGGLISGAITLSVCVYALALAG